MDHNDIIDFSSPPGSPMSDFSPPKPLRLKLKPVLHLNINGDDELFMPKIRGSHRHHNEGPPAGPSIQIKYDSHDYNDNANDSDADESPISPISFPNNPFANMSLVSSPGMTAEFYGERYLPDSKLLWSISQRSDLTTLRRMGLRCERHYPRGFVRHRNPRFPRPFETAVLYNNLVALVYLHEEVGKRLFNVHYDVPGDIVASAVRGAMRRGYDGVIRYLLETVGLDPTGTLIPARALAANGLCESLQWRLTAGDTPFNPPPPSTPADILRLYASCLETVVQADSVHGPRAVAVVTLLLDLGGKAFRGSDVPLDSVVLALIAARWEEADVIFTAWKDHHQQDGAGHGAPPHDERRIVTTWRFANECRRQSHGNGGGGGDGQREAARICDFLEDQVPHLVPAEPLHQTYGFATADEDGDEDDENDEGTEEEDGCQHWLREDRSDVSLDEAAMYQAYLDHARIGVERDEADAQLAAAVRAFDMEKLQQQEQETVPLFCDRSDDEEAGWVTISVGFRPSPSPLGGDGDKYGSFYDAYSLADSDEDGEGEGEGEDVPIVFRG